MADYLKWAPSAYRLLNGIVAVYKPPGMSVRRMLDVIRINLSDDLNTLPCYRGEQRSHITPGLEVDDKSLMLSVPDLPDLTEHRLVLGPRYIPEDIKIASTNRLSKLASGVQVLGIGKGCKLIEHMALARHMRVYHVSGRFGWATDDFTPGGKIIERTTFHHITKTKLDRMCSLITASYSKNAFTYTGLHDNSQEAYIAASQGITRPATPNTPPFLYSVKCIDFALPEFTLEVHSINEHDSCFLSLINDLALELKSTAVCIKIRRLRVGQFTAEESLLHKHWRLQHLIPALQESRRTVTLDTLAPGGPVIEVDGDTRKKLSDGDQLLTHGLKE